MMNDCIQRIIKEIESYRNLLVITGAGISTNSGISDYRDQQGQMYGSSGVVSGSSGGGEDPDEQVLFGSS